jgi:hypothetical protein
MLAGPTGCGVHELSSYKFLKSMNTFESLPFPSKLKVNAFD